MKIALSILLAMLIALMMGSCTNAGKGDGALTLGALPSIDVLPFVIAEKQGYFKKYGLDFNLQLFQSAKDRDAAFQAGALDGMCCDEVAVCIYRNAGTDLVITGMTDGEYALVAGGNSGIKSIPELKGKTVAISEKTLIEYILDCMLVKNGLQNTDAVKTAVPAVPVRLEMLASGQADAALLPEPFATFAANGGGVRLCSATQIGLYPSVIAFTKQVIAARRGDIAAMYKAYNDGVDYLNGTPVSSYEDLIIKTVGYPEDMKGKIKLPQFTKDNLPKAADLQAVIDWAVDKGLCTSELKPGDMVERIG